MTYKRVRLIIGETLVDNAGRPYVAEPRGKGRTMTRAEGINRLWAILRALSSDPKDWPPATYHIRPDCCGVTTSEALILANIYDAGDRDALAVALISLTDGERCGERVYCPDDSIRGCDRRAGHAGFHESAEVHP